MQTFYMQVTIIQGPKVKTQVFEAIKKFLFNTFETKGDRIKPVLKFNFIENQEVEEEEDEFEIELIEDQLRKIRFEEKVNKSNTGKDFDYFFSKGIEIRKTHLIPKDELLILLTGERNNRNFLGYIDESMTNAFIYSKGWDRIYSDKIDSIFPIIYEIFCWIIRANMFENSTELYKSTHKENQGCAMDFCENLNHHTQKSRSSDICENCHDLLFQNKFPEDIKKYIFESLEKVRQHILRRFIGRVDLVTIKFKYVDGTKQFIVPEFNNLILKFDPQWKVLYYFFLQHPEGIGNKDVVNYRNELYKIYKEFSVRDSEEENQHGESNEFVIESINRLVSFNQGKVYTGKNNLSGAISSLNAVLKTVFNHHIIGDYLIKNKKGKYTISLNRDWFVDEIVIKK
jgi:hypothetical protein